MNDRNLARGLFLMALSLAFGLTAFKYHLGTFDRAGPGMFPAMVSGLLFLIGLSTVIRSRFVPKIPLAFNPKNIAIIIGSLVGFAIISKFLNMIAAIVFMTFFCSLAASTYSWKRNVKISIGLVLMALLFQKGLGLDLPLY